LDSPVTSWNLFLNIELLPEPFDTSGGINQLLFARKERMAGRTNFYVNILYSRASFNDVATSTGDFSQLILGVNTLFHLCFLQK